MKDAKKWLEDPLPASNPYVVADSNKVVDEFFETGKLTHNDDVNIQEQQRIYLGWD